MKGQGRRDIRAGSMKNKRLLTIRIKKQGMHVTKNQTRDEEPWAASYKYRRGYPTKKTSSWITELTALFLPFLILS